MKTKRRGAGPKELRAKLDYAREILRQIARVSAPDSWASQIIPHALRETDPNGPRSTPRDR